jgi:O-antigen ligase
MPDRLQTFDYEPVVNLPRPSLSGVDAADALGPARTDDDERGGARRDVEPSRAEPSLLLHGEHWSGRRGHAVSFAGLLLFTLVLYFRPQDYFTWLETAHVALLPAVFALLAFIPSQLAADGTLTARPREVNLVLLLVLSAMLSAPLAIDPPMALDEFWNTCLKSAVTFILIVNVVRTESRLRIMLYLAVAVTALLCLMAINDYRLGNFAAEGYRVVGNSKGGMFENTNDLGVHLVTILPISIVLCLGGRGLPRKVIFGACMALTLVTVVITFSRGAFLGMLASGAFLAWKLGRRHRLLVFGAGGLVVALFLALAPGEYWVRLASIFVPSLDRFGSSQARSGLLEHAIVSALANPVFGLGIGNFPLTSARAQVTHNAYMQVASELGFAGALVYTMFVVAPLRRLRLIERETFEGRRASKFYYLSVGLQASLVAYMVSSFFVSVAFYLYVYYLVGYAVCLRRIYLDKTAAIAVRPGVSSEGAQTPTAAEA